jgi:hypothetical protein
MLGFLKRAAQNPAQLAHRPAQLPPIWRLWSRHGPDCPTWFDSKLSPWFRRQELRRKSTAVRWAACLGLLACEEALLTSVIRAID